MSKLIINAAQIIQQALQRIHIHTTVRVCVVIERLPAALNGAGQTAAIRIRLIAAQTLGNITARLCL